MSKTPKKIYAASSYATNSSRLCKSVEDFSLCKNLFGKAYRALLLAVEETYGTSFERNELSLLLMRCRPCGRHLKNFVALKTLIFESQETLERVKRFIEESLSALRSLKTSKATHY